MSLIERIFERGPSRSEIKELTDAVEEQNQFYRQMFHDLTQGTALKRDYHIKDYIKEGYEKNADVFSVIDRLSTMFSQIPKLLVQGEDEEPVTEGDLYDRLRQPNNYQIWQEFSKLWYTFYLTTGNAIKYAPRIQGGNDKGKLMPGGMYLMPTQHIQIEAGSWRDPIKFYSLELNLTTEKIPAEDVIHVRMPNLQYQGGANFMGMSPLKVAALIIEAENQGYQTVADTLARGIPPGILAKVQEEYDEVRDKTQQDELERAYKKKYGSQKYHRSAGSPIMGWGKMEWIPMGFSNFRDLQILEMSQHGLRVLCNVLGVPSQAFNDVAGTTFSNMGDARKMVYTNRLVPDFGLLLAYLNTMIVPAYGEDLKIKADYSDIPELQDDKKDLAQWLEVAARWGMTPNTMLKKLGLETIDNPAMDRSYLPFNIVPAEEIGMDIMTEDQVEKILKEHDIDDYKGLKAV